MKPARLTWTVAEAAAVLGISDDSYYAGIKRGELPHIRIHGRLVVPKVRLDEYLSGRAS